MCPAFSRSLRSLLCLALWINLPVFGDDEAVDLFGPCTIAQLEADPYASWFGPEHDTYVPNPAILDALSAADWRDVELTVFFGTWCGDSQREVPRLVKLLDEARVSRDRVHLIGVGHEAGLVKRSPGGEDQGEGIFRVPTIIVRRAGTEVARLIEHPSLSLERDLLAILEGEPPPASYATYPIVREWRDAGWLTDPNISAEGLANRVRGKVRSEWELATPARVFLDRGEVDAAIKLYEVNLVLHPESAASTAGMATAQASAGNWTAARTFADFALRMAKDPEVSAEAMKALERTLAHLGKDGHED